MEIAIFGVVLGLVMLSVVIAVGAHRKRLQAWRSVADELGLTFDEANDSLFGELREIPVTVHTEVRGSGKSRHTVTVIRAELDLNALPAGLEIRREGMLAKVGKLLGSEDVEVGIPEIDDAFIIRSAEPDRTIRWAQRPDVSRGLVDLAHLAKSIELQYDAICVEYALAVRDRDLLATTIDGLVDVARALSGKGYGALVYEEEW